MPLQRDDVVNLGKLKKQVLSFAQERDWEQFHSPKNLSMALSVEVAEVVEHFQWLTQEESRRPDPARLEQIRQEIGDVMIYLVRLADQLGIDPLQAADEKIQINEKKYPVEKSRGLAAKYTDL